MTTRRLVPGAESAGGDWSDAGPNRRDLLLTAGAAALALGAVRLRLPAPAGAQEAASPTADLCLLTPEQTEGPFYLPVELEREDITEGKPGVPLRLRIAVADATACTPLANAAVDLWHCDAQGYYSGVAGFTTIYPGWYTGRTVHIHMKVHIGGAGAAQEPATPADSEPPTYDGGHVVHTGQIYFDDAISDEVFNTAAAYAGRDNAQRTRNDQDGILGGHADEPGFIVTLTPLTDGAPENGFLGEITVGVDPGATPVPAGFGGPGGPPPGGPPPDYGA